jgi:hypothetical protein
MRSEIALDPFRIRCEIQGECMKNVKDIVSKPVYNYE